MKEYSRPASGFRFKFGGLKTNAAPDALPEFKYPYCQNIRSYLEEAIQSRPQNVQFQAAPGVGAGPILALEPTNGVYKINASMFVAGAAVDAGYAAGLGCSILPFRPNASPNAYDYVFDNNKASKIFVPSSGAPIVQKVGIAEPQTSPDVVVSGILTTPFTNLAAQWTPTGSAGATADASRSSEAVVAAFTPLGGFLLSAADISSSTIIQVGGTKQYQVGELVTFDLGAGNSITDVVEQVFPAVLSGTAISLQSIFYYAGNTGRCVITPVPMPKNVGLPDVQGGVPIAQSQFDTQSISSLQRGSLIKFSSNNEVCVVIAVTQGPTGGIAFEVITVANHTTADTIAGVAAFQSGLLDGRCVGKNVTSSQINSTLTGAGTALLSQNLATNPFAVPLTFTLPGGSFISKINSVPQQDDYIHVSLNIDNLNNLTSFRLIFDVNNGAADFAANAYYYDVRPNDFVPAIAGTQSQLGASQIAAQRGNIGRQLSGGANQLGSISVPQPFPGDVSPILSDTPIGSETALGTSQWTEIRFPISSLTRIGNDQTRTLANCQAVRIQIVTTATINLAFGSLWVGGGGSVDIGDVGQPIFYRVRPRNSVTGAKGNPSPMTRYGVSPRRQAIGITPPSAAYDAQIDTWDVFRFGGQLSDWKYVGSCSFNASFSDNVFDTDIANNEILDETLLEPFPSIGPPISTNTATIQGTVMTATYPLASQAPGQFGTLSQLQNLLPGNIFTVGNQAFTLRQRPTLVSSTGTTQTYLFQFVENAGSQSAAVAILQEPLLAAQNTNNVFGPDENGVFFSVGAGGNNNNNAGLRPGLIQWTNPNDPDSASDSNTKDITPTSEPLVNGVIVAGYPVVFSARGAYRGIARQDSGRLQYDFKQIPATRGLTASFGICTDGQTAYVISKDGVFKGTGGSGASLTDADLYNLFPHEGIYPAQDVTYAGNTVFAPEFKYAANFRLSVINDYLYFDYLDRTQTQRTLVCNLRDGSWSVDLFATPVTIHAGNTLTSSNDLAPGAAVRNQMLFLGDINGAIQVEQSAPAPGSGETVSCILTTREETLGDIRANKVYGDAAIDLLPAGGAVTITPVFFGSLFANPTIIAGGQAARPQSPPTINLSGEQIQRSLGLKVAWSDQGTSTILHSWQPSYITQPEDISNRITDWDDGGYPGNKFVQGFQIEIDTLNVVKSLTVRDSDTLTLHQFTSDISGLGANNVQANGQRVVTCSFVAPFIAHRVRLETLDTKIWRLFGAVKWIFEPTPESALLWQTQGTSFSIDGYLHAKEVIFAYSSSATVTLTITCFDGLSPAAIVLPSTGGAYKRIIVPLSPNKGMLYFFNVSSAQPFQIYQNDCACRVKPWGSSGPYQTVRNLGNAHGNQAAI